MKKLPSVQLIQSIQKINPEEKCIFEKKDIPTIPFNIKGLDGLETRLKNMKLVNYQHDFITEIDKVLKLYDDTELKYSEKLVLFVMNEVEQYILKPKSGEAKKELVIEICKKYFDDKPSLVELIIRLVFRELSQVKFLKRQGLKLIRFFLKVRQNQQLTKQL